ncbi:MAG: hypothetical protein HYV03_02010 [Deltaproteobacteria bacterium]|nr:hypothetical protein [Deltaproteobacteria bacterium]
MGHGERVSCIRNTDSICRPTTWDAAISEAGAREAGEAASAARARRDEWVAAADRSARQSGHISDQAIALATGLWAGLIESLAQPMPRKTAGEYLLHTFFPPADEVLAQVEAIRAAPLAIATGAIAAAAGATAQGARQALHGALPLALAATAAAGLAGPLGRAAQMGRAGIETAAQSVTDSFLGGGRLAFAGGRLPFRTGPATGARPLVFVRETSAPALENEGANGNGNRVASRSDRPNGNKWNGKVDSKAHTLGELADIVAARWGITQEEVTAAFANIYHGITAGTFRVLKVTEEVIELVGLNGNARVNLRRVEGTPSYPYRAEAVYLNPYDPRAIGNAHNPPTGLVIPDPHLRVVTTE